MDTTETSIQPAPRGRRLLFTLVSGLILLAFATSIPNILSPWRIVNIEHFTDPTRVRWSIALEGAVDLVALICIVGALVRPTRSSLLVQYILYAALVSAALILPFTAMFALTVGLLLLVPLTYPYPHQLLNLRSDRGYSVALLGVAVAAAAVLLPLAIQALRAQAALPRGNGSDFNILATNAEHLTLLAIAGLLAATRRPGWRVLAVAVTTTYAYLGLASIQLTNQPHSWHAIGGVAALTTSAAFASAGVLAHRESTTQTLSPVGASEA